MKKRLLILALGLSVFGIAATSSSTFEKAGAAFEKGLYQEALTNYSALQKIGAPADSLRALYRACESEALLFRYGDALTRLESSGVLKEPGSLKDPLWHARFLLLHSGLLRQFVGQYAGRTAQDVTEGTLDIFHRSPSELHAQIQKDFLALHSLQATLTERSLHEETYFVQTKDSDLSTYPTLQDFMLLQWTTYLLSEVPSTNDSNPLPKAEDFLGEHYRLKFSYRSLTDVPSFLLAAYLMDEASQGKSETRAQARDHWRIERLLLPFNHSNEVEMSQDWKVENEAALHQLSRWMSSLETPSGRAEAGFQAATLQNRMSHYAEAVDLCKTVESRWPSTRGAKKCVQLRASIQMPSLNILEKGRLPSGEPSIEIQARNLNKIFLRLYPVTVPVLQAARRYGAGQSWSEVLRYIDPETLKNLLNQAAIKPREWSVSVATAPYQVGFVPAGWPSDSRGLFLLAASNEADFNIGESIICGLIINAGDLVIVGSAGIEAHPSDLVWTPQQPSTKSLKTFHFYALDAKTGTVASGAKIDVSLRNLTTYSATPETATLDVDSTGRAQWPMTLSMQPNGGSSFQMDAFGRWKKDVAYWNSTLNWSWQIPSPLQVFLSTDRPIYRPGQKVQVKITSIRRIPQGYTVYDGAAKVAFKAFDANGRQFFDQLVSLNAMGSGVVEFAIPSGRLLGHYRLTAILQDPSVSGEGGANFIVEEYKRPEFEVSLLEAKEALRLGQPTHTEGDVKYYFGGPAPNAFVSYKVYREAWWPEFFWWCGWMRNRFSGRTEVLQGQTRADAQGHYAFDWTPKAERSTANTLQTARFSVHIDARDTGGRTLTTERSYVAGTSPLAFQMTPPSGFLEVGKTQSIVLRLVTLDGAAMEGDADYELDRLEQDSLDDDTQNAPLDQLFEKVESGPQVTAGHLHIDKKETSLAIKPTQPGIYRLILKTKDHWGTPVRQSIVLAAVDSDHPSLPHRISSLTLAEHASYVTGEKARFLIGSSDLLGPLYVEIWSGPVLLSRQILAHGPWQILTVPIGADHKGGLSIHWFGMHDYHLHRGESTVTVPWKEKELSVDFTTFEPVLKPGQKATWQLSVKDHDGRTVNGEALVRMYDRSLEYYASSDSAGFDQLYLPLASHNATQDSVVYSPTVGLSPDKGWIKKITDLFSQYPSEPPPPFLRSTRGQLYPGRAGGGHLFALGFAQMAMMDSVSNRVASPVSMTAPAAAVDGVNERKSFLLEKNGSIREGAEATPIRSNFAETAFFLPQVAIQSGQGKFNFSVPDQLTSWKVDAQVLTHDVKTGTVSCETVTRKELMVRVEIPRFFREGDEGSIKAVVHNETETPLSGTLTLYLSGPQADLMLGDVRRGPIIDTIRSFHAPARGLAALTWSVHVPRGVATYKVRATARSGEFVDAEERELPILPSRQRLTESTIVALNGTQTKTLTLPAFDKPDATREQESMHLQIDPQVALVILDSLRYLLHYPYECVEQTLNRFVPLAIVQEVYKKYPAIAAAAAKVPKRSTITPAWDQNDPRRLLTLMETPWVNDSEGIPSSVPLIDILDPKFVADQKQDALQKLRDDQMPSGGFPWFSGGKEDPYMTLYVLDGFVQAKQYGVDIPQDMAQRAIVYVAREIPRRLKPNPDDLSMVVYAAYILTAFDATTVRQGRYSGLMKAWADFADKHADALTPLGKAYLANVYWKLGDKAKGDDYLDRALDGSREDPITGVYWTPEKYSWLWYSDSIEKHAFFLRTLQTMRPNDKRIPGLVQWLIFNRKANVWRSTKGSAAAVYALLDVLKARGALDHGDDYKVNWGSVKDDRKVSPADWLTEPIRWNLSGKEITASQGEATIQKSGPGLSFASLTWTYSTDLLPQASEGGLLSMQRLYYRRVKEGESYHLKPLKSEESVHVGDQIEVHLKVQARSQFEYLHLQDPRGAGFEAEELHSGWKWDLLSRYEEPRDSLTNFFMNWMPQGEYELRYRVRPTTPGTYRIGAATLQSMYAPDLTAHSDGFILKVEE